MEGVYLLHFHQHFKHAQHYIGYSWDIERRIEAHRDGYGAKLTKALVSAGIGFEVARIWIDGDRDFERKLHNYNNSARLCPICDTEALKRFPKPESPALVGKHEVVPFGKKFLCTCCDQVLSGKQVTQYCSAKGYYTTWKKVPDGYKTRAQWAKVGKRPFRRETPAGKVFCYLYGKGHVWSDLFTPKQVIDIQAVRS